MILTPIPFVPPITDAALDFFIFEPVKTVPNMNCGIESSREAAPSAWYIGIPAPLFSIVICPESSKSTRISVVWYSFPIVRCA